jgi:hypothetical protein
MPGETEFKPTISEETKKEMIKFFMKTSFPRIIEEKRKELEKKKIEKEC